MKKKKKKKKKKKLLPVKDDMADQPAFKRLFWDEKFQYDCTTGGRPETHPSWRSTTREPSTNQAGTAEARCCITVETHKTSDNGEA